jgi:hypothetical protein
MAIRRPEHLPKHLEDSFMAPPFSHSGKLSAPESFRRKMESEIRPERTQTKYTPLAFDIPWILPQTHRDSSIKRRAEAFLVAQALCLCGFSDPWRYGCAEVRKITQAECLCH